MLSVNVFEKSQFSREFGRGGGPGRAGQRAAKTSATSRSEHTHVPWVIETAAAPIAPFRDPPDRVLRVSIIGKFIVVPPFGLETHSG